jgi:hypothetical protein
LLQAGWHYRPKIHYKFHKSLSEKSLESVEPPILVGVEGFSLPVINYNLGYEGTDRQLSEK